MQAASITFSDIDRAVSSENVIISGGNINMQGMSRSVRVTGEFKILNKLKISTFIRLAAQRLH